MIRGLICIIACILSSGSLRAETTGGKSASPGEPVLVRWEKVQFAWGYILEVVNPAGKRVYFHRTRARELRFRLPPGEYRFRVTALNKFRKSSGSTPWRDLEVRSPPRFNPYALVPGWPEIRVGDPRGYYWLGGFAVAALGAIHEFQVARRVDANLRSDVTARLFDGPLVLTLPESLRSNPNSALPLLAISLNAQRRLIGERDRGIRNYFNVGGLMLLLHALHLYFYYDYGYEKRARMEKRRTIVRFEPIVRIREAAGYRNPGLSNGGAEILLGFHFGFR